MFVGYILGLTNAHNQVSLTTKKCSAQGMVPSHWGRKLPGVPKPRKPVTYSTRTLDFILPVKGLRHFNDSNDGARPWQQDSPLNWAKSCSAKNVYPSILANNLPDPSTISSKNCPKIRWFGPSTCFGIFTSIIHWRILLFLVRELFVVLQRRRVMSTQACGSLFNEFYVSRRCCANIHLLSGAKTRVSHVWFCVY